MNPEQLPLPEAYHGGINFAELAAMGIDPDKVIDFSSNILPDGPSPWVREALSKARIDRYPDRESGELVGVISRVYGLDANRVMIGNGCSELIHLVASAFLNRNAYALVLGPTFSEYERVCKLQGCQATELRSDPSEQFLVSPSSVLQALEETKPELVWLCNPNNPTGRSIQPTHLLHWLDRFPRTLFVIDESYIEFTESLSTVIHADRPNLIVLRSLTKLHAIAGLRLGFAVADKELINKMRTHRIAWSVNAMAQVAGAAALQDTDYYQTALLRLLAEKKRLVASLSQMGFLSVPSDTCFFLLQVGDSNNIRQKLLKRGLLVRSCDSFALSDFVRISVRTQPENDQLIDALVQLRDAGQK
jgi:threonine-phosphate decarboxylase